MSHVSRDQLIMTEIRRVFHFQKFRRSLVIFPPSFPPILTHQASRWESSGRPADSGGAMPSQTQTMQKLDFTEKLIPPGKRENTDALLKRLKVGPRGFPIKSADEVLGSVPA